MEIYVKPVKKINVVGKNNIYIKDLAEVFTEEKLLKRVEKIKVFEITNDERRNYLISIIDIIKAIDIALPGHTISNVGEMDTIIEYCEKSKKDCKMFKYIKMVLVSIILFAGASTAIMSFHSDAQMATVFENYYYIFFNEKIENPLIIDLPYSIGLAVGIVVFFNHFSGKKLTTDPTPIEVEMSSYEANVTDNIIDTLNIEKSKKEDKNGSS